MGNLSYHGGPVLRRHTVHAIFWLPSGYSVSPNYESLIDGYFQNVANASGRSDNVYSVGAQYGDTTGGGAYQLSFAGSVVDSDPFPANGCTDGPLPVCLTDAQLQAEVDNVIAAQGWQAGLANEFFIFTPSSVGSCFTASSSTCAYSYYCAYHGSFTSSSGKGTVVYANQPYAAEPAAPGACDIGQRPNGDDADPTINLVSHEEIESITDPLLNAWYDDAGYEIGDKCAWIFGQPLGSTGGSGTNTDYNEQIGTGQYYLQQEWSNQTFDSSSGEQGACVQRDMPQLVLTGTGNGAVSGSPGIACSTITCDLSADVGTTVTLTAHPASGSSFLGWEGACSGAGACSLAVTPKTSVIARFRTSQLPTGWAAEPLAPPAGVDPLPAGADPAWSFYRVTEAESGVERATTVYAVNGGCPIASSVDSGGIFLQRQTDSGWVADGTIKAPEVGTGNWSYWPSCNEFGAEISLSADGSTLLTSQDMAPTGATGYRCAAFIYERRAGNWTPAATLFPPGIGAAGSPTSDGCDYFGINSVLSADGMTAAVLSAGHFDIYARGFSGWSLQQHVILPSADGCGYTIAWSRLAISGDGSRLLVGDPDCTVNGVLFAGRVYDYERAGSSWSLAQTLDSPEPLWNNYFGQGIALSNDGNTAAIATRESSGLPWFAGAVWVYEHDQGGWQQRVRLTTTTPDQFGLMTCPHVSSNGSTIVCSAFDTVGFNPAQGSVYVFQRPGPSWTSSPTPVRLYAGDGHAQDNLGAGHVIVNWFLPASLAVSPGGGDIATTMAAQSVSRYGKDRIGYEFTTAPVIRSFTPARAAAGGRVTITGANFADATAVTFDGVAASSFTADSPTDITATVPPTAGVGAIGVTTPKGRGWSSGSFRPEPSITSFAPAVGIAGTRVTIAGTNLLGTSAVEFGGVPATSFSVSSATRVTAVVPATATDGELTLVTPGGSASSSTSFRPEPAISLLSPRREIARARVVIKGTNLSEASSVRFAGLSAHFVVTSPTSIVARVPKLARGGHVVVQSPTGRAVSLQRFQPEPSINSVEPHRVRPGAWLRIIGGNLAGTFRVRVDGRRARFHVVTPTLVVVTVPPRARHGRITVWTWGGIRTARIVVRAKPRR